MEENTPLHPGPRELVIPEDQVYAQTDLKIYQVMEYLLTKLDPVSLEDLDADDRDCAICCMEFCVSEDERLSHPPVRTVCGHIFGKYCIIKWLDPLSYWGKAEEAEDLITHLDPEIGDTKNSCPKCRTAFFPEGIERNDSMYELSSRLRLWDMVYGLAEITLSEKEEHSRKYLWEFVSYCTSVNDLKLTEGMRMNIARWGQLDLWHHAEWLRTQALTPVQEKLLNDLMELTAEGLRVLGIPVPHSSDEDDDAQDEHAPDEHAQTEDTQTTP